MCRGMPPGCRTRAHRDNATTNDDDDDKDVRSFFEIFGFSAIHRAGRATDVPKIIRFPIPRLYSEQ